MDASDIAFLKVVVIAVILAGTGLTTYWLRLRYRAKEALRPPNEGLAEADLAELRGVLEARIGELEERVDFAERRLVQEQDERARLHRPLPTPV